MVHEVQKKFRHLAKCKNTRHSGS